MDDPNWQKAYTDSIVDGNLIKSVKSQFMTSADTHQSSKSQIRCQLRPQRAAVVQLGVWNGP